MKLFLHIGTHKTGTTAIQGFAKAQSDWLESQGVLYSNYDLIGGIHARSHLSLIAGLLKNPDDPDTEERQVLRRMHQVMLEHGKDALMSAESLFRLSEPERNVICNALKKEMPEIGFSVIAALRHPLDFADSLYRNNYREYTKVPNTAEYSFMKGPQGNLLDYSGVIDPYVDHLGAPPVLVPYTSTTRKNFVQVFLEKIGITESAPGKADKIWNPSLDTVACLAKRRALGDTVDPELSLAFNKFAGTQTTDGSYTFFSPELQDFILSKNAHSVTSLSEIEPEIDDALTGSSKVATSRQIDDACLEQAEALANAFLETQKDGAAISGGRERAVIARPKGLVLNLGFARSGVEEAAAFFQDDSSAFVPAKDQGKTTPFLKGDLSLAQFLEAFHFGSADTIFDSSSTSLNLGLGAFKQALKRLDHVARSEFPVSIVFHARNAVERAFFHYWQDISGHFAKYGSRWSVKDAKDPLRFKTVYDKSFLDEVSDRKKANKFLPQFAEMIAAAVEVLGSNRVYISYAPMLDACVADLLDRKSVSRSETALPHLANRQAPAYFYGGDEGRIFEFSQGATTQEIEIPGDSCLVIAHEHAELLETSEIDIQAVLSAADAWSYEVSQAQFQDVFAEYLDQQAAVLATLPDTCFLGDSRAMMLDDLRRLPDGLAIERTSPKAEAVTALVWDMQAKNAERDGKVMVGRNQRLFLHHDMNKVLPQHLGQVLLSEKDLDAWRTTLEQRLDYCGRAGIEYGFVIAPDTHAVYAQDLPMLDGINPTRPVLQLFEAYQGPGVYYPLDALRDAREKGEVCDVTDSHWSAFGAYVAYKATMPKISKDAKMILDKSVELSHQSVVGDLGAKFLPPRAGATTKVVVQNATAKKVWNNGVTNRGHMSFWRNSGVSKKKGLLFTDSYGWKFQRFLAESFSELFIVHTPRMEREVVEKYQPDVVINLLAERFVLKVPDDLYGRDAFDFAVEKSPGTTWPNLAEL